MSLQINNKFDLLPISLTTLSKIRNNYFRHYVKKMLVTILLVVGNVICLPLLFFNMSKVQPSTLVFQNSWKNTKRSKNLLILRTVA